MSRRFIRFLDPDTAETFRYTGHFGMKILTTLFLLLFLFAGPADSKGLTVRKNARGYQVEAMLDRYPLVLGDNHIEIEIRDASGKRLTDAAVLVNYYMPPMPRMVPMNYKTEASLEKEKYEAKMNIIMAGPWYIKVIIKHAGKISTIKFNVDAQ